jgi:glycosyltransferase involved in cell wall biosynthesis
LDDTALQENQTGKPHLYLLVNTTKTGCKWDFMNLINIMKKGRDAIIDFLVSLHNPPKSNRPIVWTEPWYSDGHNNIRYTSFLPRFKSVEPIYQFRPQIGLRGRLIKIYEQSILGRYWTFRIKDLYRLRLMGKQYKTLFCTGHLGQIRYFPGSVIVDDDDPLFNNDRMTLLNDPKVYLVVTSTELLRDKLVANGLNKPCHVIPSGVDFSQLDPLRIQHLAQQCGKEPDNIIVGYAIPEILTDQDTRVIRSSGGKLRSASFLFEVMEKVWKVLPTIKLWLIGNPSSSTMAWVSSHPQAQLFGYIPHHDLLNYIANFDIAVYPRPIDFGGRHSIKLLEFMACGCPIVSTSVSESFLVTDAKSGLLADDINCFADRIIRLAQQPDLRHTLGRNGREFAKNYDWNVLANRYESEVFLPYLEKNLNSETHFK